MYMAKYWYNTSFHSAIRTTPYESLYGRPPPLHLPYLSGELASADVDDTLINQRIEATIVAAPLFESSGKNEAAC